MPPPDCERFLLGLLLFGRHLRDELVAELADDRTKRPHRGIGERADRATLDVDEEVLEQREIAAGALAFVEAGEDLLHPVAALATRRALAAGLVREEVRDVLAGLDHVALIVHDDGACGAEAAACLLQIFKGPSSRRARRR